MTNKEFICWLNGYFELNTEAIVRERELKIIKNHLELVKSIEPTLSNKNKEIDALLNDALRHTNQADWGLKLRSVLARKIL